MHAFRRLRVSKTRQEKTQKYMLHKISALRKLLAKFNTTNPFKLLKYIYVMDPARNRPRGIEPFTA
jgi:hypothetical protein